MEPIRFIHAADLHLDATFHGISRQAPNDLMQKLDEATFTALARLFDLCEQERPDFLLLAGDIYNQEDQSLRAQLNVREGCVRLHALGIPVFMVHGNHDPLNSRLKALNWPDNVTIFDDEVHSVPVQRNNRIVAMVHGVSHASARETRNLATRFHRDATPCLQVGLLHTSLGEADGEARYAPCSLDDLKASGLHYWALGHVHEYRELCRTPLAVYPGALQGLHINEQGEKGCVLVTALPQGEDFALSTSFHALGPVVWRVVDVPLGLQPGEDPSPLPPVPSRYSHASSSISIDELDARLRQSLDDTATQLWPTSEAMIIRLRLTGRTPLDAMLRRPSVLADLTERLREAPSSGPLVWLKDLEIHTKPVIDRQQTSQREDLMGEIVRVADQYRAQPGAYNTVRAEALAALYDHPRARKVLPELSEPTLDRLLEDAESLCMDLLEND